MPKRGKGGRFTKRSRSRSGGHHTRALVRRAPSHPVKYRRAKAVGKAATSTANIWIPMALAGAAGWAKKEGKEIPHIKTLGEMGTVAAVGYGVLKFAPNVIPKSLKKLVRDATFASAVLFAFEVGEAGGLPGKSSEGKAHGDRTGRRFQTAEIEPR